MKKKKKNSENSITSLPNRAQLQLKRRQEMLEKEEKKNEKSRNALFRKRVREASDKKAPETLRTKAYYRFSSEYPSVVNPDGFRENNAQKKKLSHKKRIILLISCILVFAISFTAVQLCIKLSERDTSPAEDSPAINENTALCALHITPDELASKSADELISELKKAECNTALFEFKSEYGYVYFDINSFLGGSADKKIAGAWDTVKALSDKGINCAAYISCFKDTVAASSLTGMEIHTSSESIFRDSSNSCWLDPFSAEAHEYLLDIIKKAAEGGFTYIVLDNICFPTEYSVAAPIYDSSEITSASKNKKLTDFINSAVTAAGKEKLITLCDISAYIGLSPAPNEKYGNTLLNNECFSFCLDLRSDKQYKSQLQNSEYFNYIEEMPLAFIIDAGSLAAKQLSETKEASAAFAMINNDLEKGAAFVRHSGINNIIYW